MSEQPPRSPEELRSMGLSPEAIRSSETVRGSFIDREIAPGPTLAERVETIILGRIKASQEKSQEIPKRKQGLEEELSRIEVPEKKLFGGKKERERVLRQQERLQGEIEELEGRETRAGLPRAGDVADYQVLFGKRLVDAEQEERLRSLLREKIERGGKGTYAGMIDYLMLFGERCWSEERHQKMLDQERQKVEDIFLRPDYFTPFGAASHASRYRLLSGGERFWSDEDNERMLKGLRDFITYAVQKERISAFQVGEFVDYRILSAPEIRFSEKGIEIVEKEK